MTQKRQIDWLPSLFMFLAGGIVSLTIELVPSRSVLQYIGCFVALVLAYFAGILRGLEAEYRGES